MEVNCFPAATLLASHRDDGDLIDSEQCGGGTHRYSTEHVIYN